MISTENIAWFADIGLADRLSVGGKGGSLGELTKAGIDVPPGFVVTTAAFERFVAELEKQAPLRARIAELDGTDLAAVTETSRQVRDRVERAALPADLRGEILAAYSSLCGNGGDPVAVRSSATTEDSEETSFAGLQDTYLWVIGGDAVLAMVRRCWASLYSVESVTYRLRHGLAEDNVAMAVVVQAMVDARTAGVMFTRSPATGDRSVVTIEGAWGLGSAVVSGEVTPDHWVVAKITGEIPVREISDKHIRQVPRREGGIEELPVDDEDRRAPCLSDAELLQLKDVALKVERHYRRPQDIEWAFDRATGRLLLLQSRPETVWAQKDAEAAPVATAQADPLAHVMAIFGGRK